MINPAAVEELREYIKKRYRLVSIPPDINPPAFEETAERLAVFVEKNQHESFAGTLEKLREENGLKPAELYKRAWIDKRVYSKIQAVGNYKPKKETAIAFGLALRLTVTAFNDFLKTAGYTLSDSSMADLVIRFCVEHELWDIADVNALLFESGQKVVCPE
jgi:hypothetical protein